MIPKYLSPVDFLSGASHAFEPRKLIWTAATFTPLSMLIAWMIHWREGMEGNTERVVLLVAVAAVILSGLTIVLTLLAYITRMQVESRAYTVSGVLRFAASRLPLALALPVMLAPALAAAGILRLLGGWRNGSESAAELLNLFQVIPYIFAMATVVGVVFYAIVSAYVPSVSAVEGKGFAGSLRDAWETSQHQFGRLVLHGVVQAITIGGVLFFCIVLIFMALDLPDRLPPPLPGSSSATGASAIQVGVVFGLGLVLPVSMISTFTMLSYLALRHPASAPIASSAADETSAGEVPLQAPLPQMSETLPGDTGTDSPMDPEEAEAPTPPGGTAVPSSDTTTSGEETEQESGK